MFPTIRRTLLVSAFVSSGAANLMLTHGCERHPDAPPPAMASPSPQVLATPEDLVDGAANQALRSAGKAASVTVLPTDLAGRPHAQVGEVVAMMLERGGMNNLDLTEDAFSPPEAADLASLAHAFAAHVQTTKTATDYSLYTEIVGSRETGLTGMRAVVVNNSGSVAWADQLSKGDIAWNRANPREPLQVCILIAQRLSHELGLKDPTGPDSQPGRIAQQWERRTGIPSKADLDAMESRSADFRRRAATATLVVYPARSGGTYSPESAVHLASLLNAAELTNASAAATGPEPEIAGNMNEQKVLWSMAHALSDAVAKDPPQADYALLADYILGADSVGGVHFAICDNRGRLVAVDMQNSHWPDFEAVKPKDRAMCDELVARRLGALLGR